jgi:hypothetical protein
LPDPPSLKDRILEAILRRIEGAKDLKKRLDYLMNPETLSSSARLSEIQVQAISECAWLGETFPSLKGLAEFTQGYAKWSISREGKGREEAVAVMVSENKEIQSTLLLPGLPQQPQGKKDKKGDKEK